MRGQRRASKVVDRRRCLRRTVLDVDETAGFSLHFSHPFYCDWLRPAPAAICRLRRPAGCSASRLAAVDFPPLWSVDFTLFRLSALRSDSLALWAPISLRSIVHLLSFHSSSLRCRFASIRGCGDGSSLRSGNKAVPAGRHEKCGLRSARRIPSSRDWYSQDPELHGSLWYLTDAHWLGFRIVRPLAVPSLEEMLFAWNNSFVDEVRERLDEVPHPRLHC